VESVKILGVNDPVVRITGGQSTLLCRCPWFKYCLVRHLARVLLLLQGCLDEVKSFFLRKLYIFGIVAIVVGVVQV